MTKNWNEINLELKTRRSYFGESVSKFLILRVFELMLNSNKLPFKILIWDLHHIDCMSEVSKLDVTCSHSASLGRGRLTSRTITSEYENWPWPWSIMPFRSLEVLRPVTVDFYESKSKIRASFYSLSSDIRIKIYSISGLYNINLNLCTTRQ